MPEDGLLDVALQAQGAAGVRNAQELGVGVIVSGMARGALHFATEQGDGCRNVHIVGGCRGNEAFVNRNQRRVVAEGNRVIAAQGVSETDAVGVADEVACTNRDRSSVGEGIDCDCAVVTAQAQFGCRPRLSLGSDTGEGGAGVEGVARDRCLMVPQRSPCNRLGQVRRMAEFAKFRRSPALGGEIVRSSSDRCT